MNLALILYIDSFQLTVTNDSGEIDTDVVIITVNSPNGPPVADAGDDQLILSGSQVTINGSGSSDVDGTVVSYLWTRISGTGDSTIIDDVVKTNQNLVFTADTLTEGAVSVTHDFTLTVIDNEGASSEADRVTITVQSPNILPIAHAGFDQVVDDETLVQLDGSRSVDRGFESGISSYLWERTGGTGDANITISDPNIVNPTFTTETLTAGVVPTTHIFRLTVTDTRNAQSTDTVTITVISPNVAPTANAGPDQVVTSGSEVELDGSSSEDTGHGGDIVSYQWERVNGTGSENIVLDDPTIKNPKFIADELKSGGSPVTHIFRLTVTDNRASVMTDDNEPATDTDEVMITVNSINILPIANAGPDQIVGSVVPVTLDGSLSNDTGHLSGITSYSWNRIDGTGQNVTLTNPNTATPSFVTERIDQGSSTVSHIFELTVTDTAGAEAKDTVTIFVDAPNAPPVANAGKDQLVKTGDVVILDGSGTDIDSDDSSLTYSWEHVGGSNSRQITLNNSTTLTPSFTADTIPDGDPSIIQVFELTVTDNENATHTDTVIITIRSENVEPYALLETPHQTVASGSTVTLDGTKSFDRDGEIVSYFWENLNDSGINTVEIINPTSAIATFTADILDTGVASVKRKFRLTITDNDGLTAYVDTIIVVDSPNVGPTVNAGNDKTVNSGDIVTIGAVANDPDGSIVSYLWEYVGGTSGRAVTFLNPNIANTQFTAPTLQAGTGPVTVVLQVTVTDNDGAKTTDSVMIVVRSENIPPVSVPGPTQRVPHRSHVILDGSKSYDRGFNSSIARYWWTSDANNDPSVILVNIRSPKASFIAPKLEPGAKDLLYYFNLQVTDNDGAHHLEKTCVIVESPNLPPKANAGPDQTVNYNSTVILNGSGSADKDGDIVSYRWTRVGGTGNPSIEIPDGPRSTFISDNLTAGDRFVTHLFELTVTDDEGGVDTDRVMIIVNPPKDPPVADAGVSRRVNHNTLIQLDGSRSYDRGYNAGIASYKWESDENIEFSDATIVNPTFTSTVLNPTDDPITLNIKLTVTDKVGEIGTDTVTIIVDPPNDPPKAKAYILTSSTSKEKSAYIPSNTEVTLDGTESTDSDGPIRSYLWTRSGGTAGQSVTLTNPNTATATFTTETLLEGAKFITHIFELTVTDGIDTSVDYVTVYSSISEHSSSS